ncbi:hypothetical protein ACFE04_018461 [Oxalis oulophora]
MHIEEKIPSFSSTLLDQIYRSIDDEGDTKCPGRNTLQMKHNIKTSIVVEKNRTRVKLEEDVSSCFVQATSMKKKMNDNDNDNDQDIIFFSSSSSSDSSFGGFSSSSDTESIYASRSKSSCFVSYFPKSKKTDNKSKLKSLKILKQPISPGKSLSTFINSLFTPKKSKTSFPRSDDYTRSRQCSSNNSPATARRERLSNGVKRNVKFCPVSVILDQDLVPRVDDEVKLHTMEKSRRVEEMARDQFLRDYGNENQKSEFNYGNGEEDYDDDGASSCSSSDLFELNHLSVRYCEELPVYATSRFAY